MKKAWQAFTCDCDLAESFIVEDQKIVYIYTRNSYGMAGKDAQKEVVRCYPAQP